MDRNEIFRRLNAVARAHGFRNVEEWGLCGMTDDEQPAVCCACGYLDDSAHDFTYQRGLCPKCGAPCVASLHRVLGWVSTVRGGNAR